MLNLAFDDDDLRQFPDNDLMFGPCPLLAARYADEKLDEAWAWGENATYEASLTFWNKHVRVSLEAGCLLFWQLQLKYHPSTERTA